MPIEQTIKNGLLDFHDVKVQMYYDPRVGQSCATICWKRRNPDKFYQGPAFLNFETGKVTYPEGTIVPEYNARDHEMIPSFIIMGKLNPTEEETKLILDRLESQHKLRNGLSEDEIRAKCMESEKRLRNHAMIRLCPNNCPHISPTEEEQDDLTHKRDHICGKYGDRIYHNGNHPRLQMLDNCDLWGEA